MTCADLLIRLLGERYGVDTLFGIPGVHTVELYRGLEGREIRHVTPRHEQGAGFMADGYARATGKPGVCLIITGPGIPTGKQSDVMINGLDFYPTILAATGLPLNLDQHMDGVDLTPVLKGMGPLNRDAIYWHYPHYNQHPESFAGSVIRKIGRAHV